jgi:hypothetical protein
MHNMIQSVTLLGGHGKSGEPEPVQRIDLYMGDVVSIAFQPHMCMLQWRHSGLVNYLNRTPNGLQVRVEGLWIG